MPRNREKVRSVKSRVSSPSNTCLAGCAALALLLWSGAAVAAEPTHADEGGQPPSRDGVSRSRHSEVAARATFADMKVGMLGVGVEGAYFLSPHFALGGTVEAFVVDNGADPNYSEPGTLSGPCALMVKTLRVAPVAAAEATKKVLLWNGNVVLA